METSEMVELLRKHIELEVGQDEAGSLATLTDDCHYEFPFHGVIADGKEEIAAYYRDLFANNPVGPTEIAKYWRSDDTLFAELITYVEGPDGTSFPYPMIVRAEMRDGLLSQEVAYFNGTNEFMEKWAATTQAKRTTAS